MIDIIDFIPKYPNIHNEKEPILNPYSIDFYESIYRKKEFYEDKLSKTENIPSQKGETMKHQRFISKFFSSRTIYDKLLLVHEMGTGKTCVAINAIEQIRKEKSSIKGAMYFAGGDTLINNFINELLNKCTKGEFTLKEYKKYYKLLTFEKFSTHLSKLKDEEIKELYSDNIIIIDEVHNLRIGLKKYEQFFRLCHIVTNCKILLMSGTPMKNDPYEIASILNLILPLELQLPTENDFTIKYFNIKDLKTNIDLSKNVMTQILELKPDKVNDLKKYMKGRISYLLSMKSDVKKKFIGELMDGINHLILYPNNMSDFQSNIYKQSYIKDKTDKEGIYNNCLQATLFVFPDGSYGQEGFNKYVIKRPQKNNVFTYTIQNSLLTEFKGDINDKLKVLEKYSSIYYKVIKHILTAQKEGECLFIYCRLVDGSGIILFSKILEMFGFSMANGDETSEKPRYALLINQTSSNIRKIINRFNQPDNMRGKFINVVIGSRIISEGITLNNIQQEHILTPFWNYTEISQVISRGYRLGSHTALIKAGINPEVKIFQHVSIPKNDTPSINYEMYKICETKDINIKQIERIFKESALDCALNYERNYTDEMIDGSRDCDYTLCKYTCDGIPEKFIYEKLEDLDYSTYQLYYNEDRIKKITNLIFDLFRTKFSASFNDIYNSMLNYTEFEILTALKYIIDEKHIIINKYGFISYLKEYNNIYFLVDNIVDINNFFSKYYSENIILHVPTTFNDIVYKLYIESFPKIVEMIFKINNEDELKKILNNVPLQLKELLLESCLLSLSKNTIKNKKTRDIIINYFKYYYYHIDGTYVSSLLYEENNTLRCLEDTIWKDCDEKFTELINNVNENRKKLLQYNNKYGYYGQENPDIDAFCIRDVTFLYGKSDSEIKLIKDKRKIKSGIVCADINRENLTKLAVKDFKIPIPKKDLDNFNNSIKDQLGISYTTDITDVYNNQLINILKNESSHKKKKYGVILFNLISEDKDISTLTSDELLRSIYWVSKQKEFICEYIQKWMRDNDMTILDTFCGVSEKKIK